MELASITPVILTWNEEPNLHRCLDRLAGFPRVIVLDSGSSDGTREIASSFPNVTFAERRFDNHTAQWNHGLALADTPWILSLDADYVLDSEFPAELESLTPPDGTNAYHARFRYCVAGRPLRATLYPPRAVLFRRDVCTYRQDGHTQLLDIRGNAGMLESRINHDDRKPLSRWIQSQDRYAVLEAGKLSQPALDHSSLQDRLRKSMVLAPPATLIYCLAVKGLLFDGWRGWFYTVQRVLAEIMLALHLLDHRLSGKPPHH